MHEIVSYVPTTQSLSPIQETPQPRAQPWNIVSKETSLVKHSSHIPIMKKGRGRPPAVVSSPTAIARQEKRRLNYANKKNNKTEASNKRKIDFYEDVMEE
jgi:hypothetical protein